MLSLFLQSFDTTFKKSKQNKTHFSCYELHLQGALHLCVYDSKNGQVVKADASFRPLSGWREHTHWSITLCYQRSISWPLPDGLMMERRSFMFHNIRMPTDTSASAGKGARWCTLSFSQPVTLPRYPPTPPHPPSCCRRVQRLTDLVKAVSGGLDWEAEDPVSVLCKVQSCVTYWHARVCLEYHRVLCGVLEKINK